MQEVLLANFRDAGRRVRLRGCGPQFLEVGQGVVPGFLVLLGVDGGVRVRVKLEDIFLQLRSQVFEFFSAICFTKCS